IRADDSHAPVDDDIELARTPPLPSLSGCLLPPLSRRWKCYAGAVSTNSRQHSYNGGSLSRSHMEVGPTIESDGVRFLCTRIAPTLLARDGSRRVRKCVGWRPPCSENLQRSLSL